MAKGQGGQAKTLTDKQVRDVLAVCDGHRYPLRDRVMVLLSFKAGLRAKEIALVTWGMVTDAEGNVGNALALTNVASKGKTGGRTIPLNKELKAALVALKASLDPVEHDDPIIFAERTLRMTPGSVQIWFHRVYSRFGWEKVSSHSGRRTFITNTARKISMAGGSLLEIQEMAGHASLQTTQRYIDSRSDAKQRVVDMI